jgi:hypothetical protein
MNIAFTTRLGPEPLDSHAPAGLAMTVWGGTGGPTAPRVAAHEDPFPGTAGSAILTGRPRRHDEGGEPQ